MTDPTAHWSPSEVDDDGDRASYPPPPALDLDAIEARAAAVYPGPWRAGTLEAEGKVWAHDPEALGGPSCGERCVFIANKHFEHTANREFIAHARQDVPALVARVRELEAQLSATEAEARTALDALHARLDAAEAERRGIRESIAYVGASCDREVMLDGVWLRASRLGAPSSAHHYAEVATERDEWKVRAEKAEADAAAAETLAGRLGDLLRATADALKGPPPPLGTHSTHDLPEVAAEMRRRDELSSAIVGLNESIKEQHIERARALGRFRGQACYTANVARRLLPSPRPVADAGGRRRHPRSCRIAQFRNPRPSPPAVTASRVEHRTAPPFAIEADLDHCPTCGALDLDHTCHAAAPCTCGSGGHPRGCRRHPEAFTAHVAELNAENNADAAAGERFAAEHPYAAGAMHGGIAHKSEVAK